MKFYQYILVLTPIGHDFRYIVSNSYAWLHSGVVPSTIYPPFTLLFFTPFTFVGYEVGYKILIGIILICYLSTTFIFPHWINQHRDISALEMLVMVTGFISYGFQFEAERGQWNLIAFFFSVASIYIFHNRPKHRWLAYLLFTISVQLKLFPAIFVFTLIDDLSDWKNNIRRIIGLGCIQCPSSFYFRAKPNPKNNRISSIRFHPLLHPISIFHSFPLPHSSFRKASSPRSI